MCYRTRKLDRDNLVGGCKPVCDSLRVNGYIRDDDSDSFEAFYMQRPCLEADERVEIYLFHINL